MELQRAQRNLKFLQNEDFMNITDQANLNGESQRAYSLGMETQVPEVQFSLSSDDDSIGTQEEHVTAHKLLVAKETTKKDTESNKDVDISFDPTGISQPDLGEPNIVEENVFINTQIQSRLDDAEEETNLKLKLKQFKYSFKDNNASGCHNNANIVAKRRPAIRKTNPKLKPKTKSKRDPNIIKNITDFNINNYERSRTASLLKQLSGKHKKVLDIIKTQNEGSNGESSKARNSKSEKATFDTYSEQEWKYVMKLFLQKFPHSEETDLNEVQKFLYGCEQSSSSLDNQKTSQQKLWTASQLPPELPDETIQPEQEARIRDTQSAVNFLSLSQVMDDKSEIMKDEESIIMSGGVSTGSQEYGNKLEPQLTVGNVVDENIELTVGTRINGFSLTDYKAYRHMPVEVNTRCENSKSNDYDDISVVSDTTDETSTLFPLDQYRYVFLENDEKPPLTTDTIGSTQFFTPNTSPLDGIIDLTQESFKAVRSLISPLKVENNKTRTTSQALNQVQVPATRTPTIVPQKDLTKALKTEQEMSDIGSFIRVKLLRKNAGMLNPELMKHSCYRVEANDSEEEETELDDQLCIADIQLADSTKISTEVSIQNPGNNINDVSDASPTTSPEKLREIIMSQSMKELRQSLKSVGLKPMRTKVEIIQSLQTASQILSIANPGNNDEHRGVANFSKIEIFDHLTELIQAFPDFLERIYTFEPIPLNELIEKLFSAEPFVSQIDEMTIREWADVQGICLRNDKK
ncbi:Slx4p [Saccharomyces paradoxus]|uniref:Structure-specific endonuclease subunit SLX4 n=1 Tax=Saccharomyces paradoxus TaxID=27291 RepID=A0A8B8UVV8_SACPA|nr:Slx4 [Saccharomyces paradoxus]QHS74872.1 Slx4 [Saccharomyces paradoxus]